MRVLSNRRQLLHTTATADKGASSTPDVKTSRFEALELIRSLCQALNEGRVAYCHWKSNEALDQSAKGSNDLDLLIGRDDAQLFEEIIARLGFKATHLPRWKQLPGVLDWYGHDEASGKLVHLHAHYQLTVGDDMTKNYRLPIEEPYIASAQSGALFKVPLPEFEFAVFLVRMVLKHCTWDALLMLQGSLSSSEQRELSYLTERVDVDRMWALMTKHLPFVPRALWDRCLLALQPGASVPYRAKTACLLERYLAACGRRPWLADIYLKIWRRIRSLLRQKLFRRGPIRVQPSAGGTLVALVGGDGAGKSTAASHTVRWLAKEFQTVGMHLGKPPRSLSSTAVRRLMGIAATVHKSPDSSALALRQSLAAPDPKGMSVRHHARLVWEVLTARDRYRAFRRARRLASNGVIVVCDRFPLPQIKIMDSAVSALAVDVSRGGLFRYLARLERRFYDRISYPDLLVVLRVHPDIAVQRKIGEESESYLRPRSEEVWHVDWQGTPAVVIDAGRPSADVLSEIRSLVWSRL